MEGEWIYQENNRTHKIRAKLPLTLSISKHKLSVFLDDKLIHKSDYIAVVAGEIERLEINGNIFVFSVTGFGILGKLRLQINGRDAQTIDQLQMLSTGNQIQPKPTAQYISKSNVETWSGHIFISYRRSDSADVAGRIYDRLIGKFGKAPVFKDVDSIPLGLDFKDYLEQKVSECNVLLAIIGDRWLDATDPTGKSRLEDPSDFVRIEIQSALDREIPVIPILVRNAPMPQEESLPFNLRKLVYRNGIPIRSDPDFHRDMDRLISALEKYMRPE